MGIYVKDEAFVLKIKLFKEADAVLNLFTKDYGKILGVIKGLKTSTKNIYVFDQLNYIKAFFVIKNERVKILSGLILKEIKIPNENLKNWFWTLKVFNYFTIKGKPENELFNLLIFCSKILNKKVFGYKSWLLLKILKIMGIFPFDIFCSNCGKIIDKGFFDKAVFCKYCYKERNGIEIKKEDILKLKEISNSNFPNYTSKKLVSIIKKAVKDII